MNNWEFSAMQDKWGELQKHEDLKIRIKLDVMKRESLAKGRSVRSVLFYPLSESSKGEMAKKT